MICLTARVPHLTSLYLPWSDAMELDTAVAARLLDRLEEIRDDEIAQLKKAR